MPLDPPVRYVVDNSVWQRQRQPAVRQVLDRVRARRGSRALLICPPAAAGVGFSARSGADHDVVARALATFSDCAVHPSSSLVLALQNAIFTGGYFRAVGALDTVIAAYALVNEAVVLHYDRDFEFVARVRPDFQQEWIAPAGSLDR